MEIRALQHLVHRTSVPPKDALMAMEMAMVMMMMPSLMKRVNGPIKMEMVGVTMRHLALSSPIIGQPTQHVTQLKPT
jgi:hypothetical protein